MRVYCSVVRPVVESASVVYGPMMSNDQSEQTERLQSQSLKIIYGFHKSYREVLEISGVQTLEARRREALEKFAKKSLEGNYSHWFPLADKKKATRHGRRYKEEYARCDRLKNSPIFHMRRVLNKLYDN